MINLGMGPQRFPASLFMNPSPSALRRPLFPVPGSESGLPRHQPLFDRRRLPAGFARRPRSRNRITARTACHSEHGSEELYDEEFCLTVHSRIDSNRRVGLTGHAVCSCFPCPIFAWQSDALRQRGHTSWDSPEHCPEQEACASSVA
jgi:hypothetical protein